MLNIPPPPVPAPLSPFGAGSVALNNPTNNNQPPPLSLTFAVTQAHPHYQEAMHGINHQPFRFNLVATSTPVLPFIAAHVPTTSPPLIIRAFNILPSSHKFTFTLQENLPNLIVEDQDSVKPYIRSILSHYQSKTNLLTSYDLHNVELVDTQRRNDKKCYIILRSLSNNNLDYALGLALALEKTGNQQYRIRPSKKSARQIIDPPRPSINLSSSHNRSSGLPPELEGLRRTNQVNGFLECLGGF